MCIYLKWIPIVYRVRNLNSWKQLVNQNVNSPACVKICFKNKYEQIFLHLLDLPINWEVISRRWYASRRNFFKLLTVVYFYSNMTCHSLQYAGGDTYLSVWIIEGHILVIMGKYGPLFFSFELGMNISNGKWERSIRATLCIPFGTWISKCQY